MGWIECCYDDTMLLKHDYLIVAQSMYGMFQNESFNHDLSLWDVLAVTDIVIMVSSVVVFQQNK